MLGLEMPSLKSAILNSAVLMSLVLAPLGAGADAQAPATDTRPAARALDGLRRAWTGELADFTAATAALAVADDTYEFVVRPNIPYVDEHYAVDHLADQRINTILIVNLKGKPLFWRRVNLGINRGFVDAEAFLTQLPPLPPAGERGVPAFAGAMQLAQGPSLVVAMPIYAQSGSGDSRGWLIAVRPLNAMQWRRYEERAGVEAEVLDPAAAPANADMDAALSEPLTPVIRLSGSRIHGLLAVPDVQGKPLRVFSVLLDAAPIAAKPAPVPAAADRHFPWLAWLAILVGVAAAIAAAVVGRRRLRGGPRRPDSQAGRNAPPAAPTAPAAAAIEKLDSGAVAPPSSLQTGAEVAHVVANTAAARWEQLRVRIRELTPVCCFQPQIDLQTGRVAGVEALLGGATPGNRRAMAEFIEEVEVAGLGFALAQRWIQEACRNQRAWLQQVSHEFPIGVPISQRALEDPQFLPFLRRTLAEYDLPPHFLELEIPEAVLGGSASALRAIADVQAAGVGLAIDGFNAARSNLRLLTMTRIAKLRIDPALVRKIGVAGEEAVLFDGICGAARGLGIIICANGVDSPDLVAAAMRHGRPLAQGEALGPCIDADQFLLLLRGNVSETWNLPPLQVDDVLAEKSGTADGAA
jgi:EAL domain-containing protein (putative c-di-GMP-specific phosphodiesterase class I)/sensor domain CHASE-containing protein